MLEYEELAKTTISLRELKETRFRLRVLRATGLLTDEQDPVIRESDELVKIVARIVRNSSGPDESAELTLAAHRLILADHVVHEPGV